MNSVSSFLPAVHHTLPSAQGTPVRMVMAENSSKKVVIKAGIPAPLGTPLPIGTQWKNLANIAWVKKARGHNPVNEPPYIYEARNLLIRYKHEEATQPRPEIARDDCPLSFVHSHPPLKITGWYVPYEVAFKEYDEKNRRGYLRGSSDQSLPQVLEVDYQKNTMTFQYRGERLSWLLGHPPLKIPGYRSTIEDFKPLLFSEVINATIRLQGSPCASDWDTSSFFEIGRHLQMLDDLVGFIGVMKEEGSVGIGGRVIYRQDLREIRFIGNRPSRPGTSDFRYSYRPLTGETAPLVAIFPHPMLISSSAECRPYLKSFRGLDRGPDRPEPPSPEVHPFDLD